MAEFVAQITQTEVDKLMADPIWEYDFVLNEQGDICMDLRDAAEMLLPGEFVEIEWFDYYDANSNFIGIPKPKRKKA